MKQATPRLTTRRRATLLRFHADDGTPARRDAAVVFGERERFRRAIWRVAREFTHVALSDLLRDGLYEIACGYHYWRQEARDIQAADGRLARLRGGRP